jgi:hypothetical protein
MQGRAGQARELDRSGQRELGGDRPIGADDDSVVDRSSSARVRKGP